MKKITYLVAPLMVLPLLVGCGGGGDTPEPPVPPEPAVTHTLTLVSEWTTETLSFTDAEGKAIEGNTPVTITEGQDFIFNVSLKEAENADHDSKIHQDYIMALSGEEMNPLTMGFEPNADETAAKFTIYGKDITDDISLIGAEYKEGMYLCAFPYILGTHVSKVKAEGLQYTVGDWYGYVPLDSNLKITFSVTSSGALPLLENILLSRNLGDFENPSKVKTNWAWYEVADYASVLHINKVSSDEKDRTSVFISARGRKSTILEELSWEEIQEIVDAGEAPMYFNYGETKTIEVNGHNHIVKIIGFDHDKAVVNPDEVHTLTFQFSTVVSNSEGEAITTSWNDVTGSQYEKANNDFRTSVLRKKLEDVEDETFKSVLEMLPPILQKIIKPVTKYVGVSNNDGASYTATTFETKLFPLAEVEAYGKETLSREVPEEGTEYGFYREGYKQGKEYSDMRKAYDANGGLSGVAYWTRSPLNYEDYQGRRVYAINTVGAGDNTGWNCYDHGEEFGMLPAFCI